MTVVVPFVAFSPTQGVSEKQQETGAVWTLTQITYSSFRLCDINWIARLDPCEKVMAQHTKHLLLHLLLTTCVRKHCIAFVWLHFEHSLLIDPDFTAFLWVYYVLLNFLYRILKLLRIENWVEKLQYNRSSQSVNVVSKWRQKNVLSSSVRISQHWLGLASIFCKSFVLLFATCFKLRCSKTTAVVLY